MHVRLAYAIFHARIVCVALFADEEDYQSMDSFAHFPSRGHGATSKETGDVGGGSDESAGVTDEPAASTTPAEQPWFEYDLIGVTVHIGTADGGHYYSFIRDKLASLASGQERW